MKRWVVRIMLGLLALVLVAVTGALVYATSDAGNARLLRLVLESVNGGIQGKLVVTRLSFGLRHLRLEGVALADPEGATVARFKVLDVRLSPGALLHRLLHVNSIRLESPEVLLTLDPDGSNLARAIAPREEGPEPAPSPPSKSLPVSIEVDSVELSEGLVNFRQQSAEGVRTVRVEQLALGGRASVRRSDKEIAARLTLDGRLEAPVKGPLHVALEASDAKGTQTAQVQAQLAGAELLGNAALTGTEQADVVLKSLKVPPAWVRAFVPSYPVSVPVVVAAHAHKEGNAASATLEVSAGSGALHAEAKADIAKMEVAALTVTATNLDLSQLMEDGPRSKLAFTLTAAGGGTSVDTAHGHLDLELPPAPVRGTTLGPVRVHASAANGRYDVRELLARLPGLKLTAKGKGSLEHVALTGRLEASDLALLSRTLGGLTQQKLPKVAGIGALDLRLEGPIKHPGVYAKGGFEVLRVDANAVQGLTLDAAVPNVLKPLESNLQVNAKTVTLGARVLKDVGITLATRGRSLEVNLHTQGMADVNLHLGGTLDADSDGLLLSALELTYPEEQWRLAHAAHLRFSGGDLSTEPLILDGGAHQNVFLEGKKTGSRIDAHLEVNRLDLGRLPRALVPPDAHLGGLFSVKATAKGTLEKPSVSTEVSMKSVRFQRYTGIELAMRAHYEKDRAVGELHTRGLLDTKLDATFDVPVQALVNRRHVPVEARLELEETPIEKLLCTYVQANPEDIGLCDEVQKKALARGMAHLLVTLTGTADAPKLESALTLKQLAFRDLPPADVALTLGNKDRKDGTLAAALALTGYGGGGNVRVETPLTLAALLGHPPTAETAKQLPLHVSIAFDHLSVGPARALADLQQDVQGTLSARGDFKGPALGLLGELKVQLHNLVVGPMAPAEVVFALDSRAGAIAANLMARNAHGTLAELKARIDGPMSKVAQGAGVAADLPLVVDATVGPLQLADLPALSQGNGKSVQKLHGKMGLHVKVSGSLADPAIALDAHAEAVGLGKRSLGRMDLTYGYGKTKHTFQANLSSAGGGTLAVRADSTLDVSYRGMLHGVQSAKAPLTASLNANHFDLAFLSGLAPSVRRMAGQLVASAQLTGTVGAPRFEGNLELLNGSMALEGYGNYDSVHLKAAGQNDRATLQDLTLKSGEGRFTLTAQADKQGEGFHLVAHANGDKFPITNQDQLYANITLQASVEGTASSERIDIRTLKIPEAHIELPDVKRKNLQDLGQPDDIYLTRNGVAVDKKKRTELVKAREAEKAKALAKAQVGSPVLAKATPGAATSTDAAKTPLYITLQAPRNIWVKGYDVQAELGFSDGFRVEVEDALQIFGEVKILRGRADELGRRFDIEKNSQVRFTGPPAEPQLDIAAVYKNEKEQVTVTLHITGSGKNIQLKPTSEPPLTETEIYTLLATGRASFKSGGASSSPTEQAASIVGSLVATQIKNAIAKVVPLDVLSVEAGDQGVGFETNIEAGKYIGDRFYVGGHYRAGADPYRLENPWEFKAEYQISKHWSAEGTFGPLVNGADFIWLREY